MSRRPDESAMTFAARALRELSAAWDVCSANIRETRRREFDEAMQRARQRREAARDV